jgi:hypothetical protein
MYKATFKISSGATCRFLVGVDGRGGGPVSTEIFPRDSSGTQQVFQSTIARDVYAMASS